MQAEATVTPDGTEYTDDYLIYGGSVEIRIEVITPERAREYLRANDRNRRVRDTGVGEIVAALRAGDWRFNGDAIRIDVNGVLLDGQHRLLACVEAGIPITALVITGLEPEVQQTIDIGRKRSVADALAMAGYTDTTVLAGGLVLLDNWIRHGVVNRGGGKSVVSPKRALALVADHPEFPRHARFAKREALRALATPSAWAVTSYIITRIDAGEAALFFEGVMSGAGLDKGDPRLVLRDRFLRDRQQGKTAAGTVSQSAMAWMILRAWRRFQQRATISKLQLPASLTSPDVWHENVPTDTLRAGAVQA